MRPGAGKRKGTEFERGVAKLLSLWMTHGTRDDVLWRSAISGGRTTIQQKKKTKPSLNKNDSKLAHVGGDICAVHPLGAPFINTFFVELKFYRDLNLGRVLVEQDGLLIRFWRKACNQAAAVGKHPLLVFKENRGAITVGTTVHGFTSLGVEPRVTVCVPKIETMYVFPFDVLLSCQAFPLKAAGRYK